MSTDIDNAPSPEAPDALAKAADEPESIGPDTTEPEATEPEATEVEATEVEATEVEAGAVEETEPEATESEATEVEGTGAEAAQPRQVIVPPSVDELPDDIDDFEAAINQTVIEFREGDIVEGTVVSVDADGAMIDVGYKSEGLIPIEELSIRANVDPSTIVSVGDKVEALVLNKEDDEGRLILSKKRAQYERAWGKVAEVTEAGGTVKGTVIEVVKGGLIVDIGLRGFLPASLVDLRRVRDLDPFIGTEIEAKVIELDRNRNNVVLSRRAYLEEEQAEQRAAFLDDLHVGEVRAGVVSSVVNFGAFVDLGGMDGLVHVSEMSWQHISHPSEMVKVGDDVNIKVLEVDRERERISLSIRQTLEDPWEVFSRQNNVGDVIDGLVTKTVPFGAFVSVSDGVEGLVHVSEIAIHRVESPELELSINQPVRVKITEKEDERRRISLSIKQALPDWQERSTAPQSGAAKRPAKREFEREFGPTAAEPEPIAVDASLEAILQELKERGIGRR
ncbi:MAG: 30S ribosomal protein S1 [Actinobacteria bacterium]|nr:30S ribosomal protein S1 [Actinomycetota bacterium]